MSLCIELKSGDLYLTSEGSSKKEATIDWYIMLDETDSHVVIHIRSRLPRGNLMRSSRAWQWKPTVTPLVFRDAL